MNLALSRIPGFDSSPVDVRYLVSKMSLVRVFLRLLRFPHLVGIIPPLLRVHLYPNTTLTRRTRGRSLGTGTTKRCSCVCVHWSGGYLDVVFQASEG